MFKKAKNEIDLLFNDLIRKGKLSDREIQIGIDCYNLGRISREQEILENRKLFEGKDEDEK